MRRISDFTAAPFGSMHDQGCVVRHTSVKGVGSHLPERPFGCFAQMTPDPFYNRPLLQLRSPNSKVHQLLAVEEARPKVMSLPLGDNQFDNVAGFGLLILLDKGC